VLPRGWRRQTQPFKLRMFRANLHA
jgi:hypothetical protein